MTVVIVKMHAIVEKNVERFTSVLFCDGVFGRGDCWRDFGDGNESIFFNVFSLDSTSDSINGFYLLKTQSDVYIGGIFGWNNSGVF